MKAEETRFSIAFSIIQNITSVLKNIRFGKMAIILLFVTTPAILLQKLDYIHNNPVKTGIVTMPEHYTYSSAANYAGEEGVLPISLLDTGFFLADTNK